MVDHEAPERTVPLGDGIEFDPPVNAFDDDVHARPQRRETPLHEGDVGPRGARVEGERLQRVCRGSLGIRVAEQAEGEAGALGDERDLGGVEDGDPAGAEPRLRQVVTRVGEPRGAEIEHVVVGEIGQIEARVGERGEQTRVRVEGVLLLIA